MSEKPKRRWFRFHLSTAVVLMLAAGGIMWANARPEHDFIHEYQSSQSAMIDDVGEGAVCYHYRRIGWPFEFWEVENNVCAYKGTWLDCNPQWDKSDWVFGDAGKWNLCYDAAIWIGSLVMAGILWELLIRSNEKTSVLRRIHRPTALLLILTAGVFVLLMSQHRSISIPIDFRYKDGYEIGWPMSVGSYLRITWDYRVYTLYEGPRCTALIVDCAIFLLTLVFVAMLFDFVIGAAAVQLNLTSKLGHMRWPEFVYGPDFHKIYGFPYAAIVVDSNGLYTVEWDYVVLDVFCAAIALLSAAVIFENIIRRREAK